MEVVFVLAGSGRLLAETADAGRRARWLLGFFVCCHEQGAPQIVPNSCTIAILLHVRHKIWPEAIEPRTVPSKSCIDHAACQAMQCIDLRRLMYTRADRSVFSSIALSLSPVRHLRRSSRTYITRYSEAAAQHFARAAAADSSHGAVHLPPGAPLGVAIGSI
jgi:hypothetical protein